MMNDGEGGAIAAAHPDVVEGVGDHGSGKLLPGDSDKARWRGCRS